MIVCQSGESAKRRKRESLRTPFDQKRTSYTYQFKRETRENSVCRHQAATIYSLCNGNGSYMKDDREMNILHQRVIADSRKMEGHDD